MKICKICHAEKDESCFSAHRLTCKQCCNEVKKLKYLTNLEYREAQKAGSRKRSIEKKDEIRLKVREYQSKPDIKKRRNEKRRAKYKMEGVSSKMKIYSKKYMKAYNKYYRKRPDIIIKRRLLERGYYQRHKDNPDFRLKRVISSSINKAVNNKSGKSWRAYVDYNIEELRVRLESLFTEGMSWGNYGDWQIDHIIPISAFDLMDKIQIRTCWSLENLQPLWRIQNASKGDLLPGGGRPRLN